jgi:hypothetical protein
VESNLSIGSGVGSMGSIKVGVICGIKQEGGLY